MGAKKTVQKQGSNEKALLSGGEQKRALGEKIAGRATQYVNETSTKDYSGLQRGRLKGDAAQALAGANRTAYSTAAGGNGRGLSGLSRVNSATTKAFNTALSEGTKRGTQARDANIFSAADVSMGKQAGSARNQAGLAKTQAAEIATQAQIAATEANNMRGAAMGLATAGLGAYQQNKMDGLREDDMLDFEAAKADGLISKDMSYADFSQQYEHEGGRRGAGYLNKNLSWADRMGNALGGAG